MFSNATMSYSKKELYGGALTCDIPTSWRDVSQVRQVPDHQEVFQNCSSTNSHHSNDENIPFKGACLIFEILEHQTEVSNQEACSFFFNDLADANGTPEQKSRVLTKEEVVRLGHDLTQKKDEGFWLRLCEHFKNVPNITVCLCTGKQLVVGAGMRESDPRAKNRKQWVKVEMCIFRLKDIQTEIIISISIPTDKEDEIMSSEPHLDYSSVFKNIISSFQVVDWSLFA